MSNHSGIEFTTINNRERAVSTDINGMQSQAAKALALQMQRGMSDQYLDANATDWDVGHEYPRAVDGTPLQADVIAGLKVRPFPTFCLVSEGSLGVRATSTNYDAAKDAEYMLINDPGVTDSSVLPFAANAAGSLRVDVIECEVTEVISSFENRDIYDPLTGLFTAALVTKISAGRLGYRIRQGTPGAGYAGNTGGWLPLVIIVHQIGSASFDAADFYDVRPLIQDRTYAPTMRSRESIFAAGERFHQGVMKDEGATDEYLLGGSYILPVGGGPDLAVNRMGAYKCEGRICPTIPGLPTDTTLRRQTISLNDTSYHTPGTSAVLASKWMHVVSVQPYGLPRWRRYGLTAGISGEREPGPNFGLLCLADQSECNPDEAGVCSASMQLPLAYGMPGISDRGRVVATVRQTGASGDFYRTTIGRGNFMTWTDQAGLVNVSETITDGVGFMLAEFEFSSRGQWIPVGPIPAYCSGVRFKYSVTFEIAALELKNPKVTTSLRGANVSAVSGQFTVNREQTHAYTTAIGTGYRIEGEVEFRLPSELIPNAAGVLNASLGNLTFVVHIAPAVSSLTQFVDGLSHSAQVTGIYVGY